MGEIICKWRNWQGIYLQNVQQVMHLNLKKTNNEKMDGRPEQTFLQRHTDG